MKLLEASYSTLDANRFHFSEKLVKISNNFAALKKQGSADKFMEFSEKFKTSDDLVAAVHARDYRLFVPAQYKLLERECQALYLLLKTQVLKDENGNVRKGSRKRATKENNASVIDQEDV